MLVQKMEVKNIQKKKKKKKWRKDLYFQRQVYSLSAFALRQVCKVWQPHSPVILVFIATMPSSLILEQSHDNMRTTSQ